MPSRPPGLKAKPKRPAFERSHKKTTTERGYGWKHQQMRNRVLREEPLCRMCLALDPPMYTPSKIADHITPLAEDGSGDRENYQGLCGPCSDTKTAAEAKRGARKSR